MNILLRLAVAWLALAASALDLRRIADAGRYLLRLLLVPLPAVRTRH